MVGVVTTSSDFFGAVVDLPDQKHMTVMSCDYSTGSCDYKAVSCDHCVPGCSGVESRHGLANDGVNLSLLLIQFLFSPQ